MRIFQILKPKSIVTKLTWVNIVWSSIIITGVFVSHVVNDRQEYREFFQKDRAAITRKISASLVASHHGAETEINWGNSVQIVHNLTNDTLDAIFLLGKDGRLLSSYYVKQEEKEKAATSFEKLGKNFKPGIKTDGNYIYVIEKIDNSDDLEYVVTLWGQERVTQMVNRYSSFNALLDEFYTIFWSILCLNLFFFLIARGWVMKPLRRITEVLGLLSKEGTNVQIPETHRNDEIGKIALAAEIFSNKTLAAERVKSALGFTESAIMLTDDQGRIIYANNASVDLFRTLKDRIREKIPGFSHLRLVGFAVTDFHRMGFHYDFRDLTRSFVDDADGDGYFLRIRGEPVKDKRGVSIGAVLEWKNLSDEKVIHSNINDMIKAVMSGQFNSRIDISKVSGFMKSLAERINQMIARYATMYADMQKQAEKLHLSQERYELASKAANDALWDWLVSQETIYFSPRWKEMLGIPVTANFTTLLDWLDLVHPDYQDMVRKELSVHIEGGSEKIELEYQIYHSSGRYIWVKLRGLRSVDEQGKTVRLVGSQTDIDESKKFQNDLVRAAFYDPLTGLPNRALLTTKVEHQLSELKRDHRFVAALMLLDLDRFKVINDSMGHQIGDKLLTHIAKRVESAIRPCDIVARLGGDEFVVLTDNLEDEDQAIEIAKRIISAVEMPLEIEGKQIHPSTSIGINIIDHATKSVDAAVRDADIAMYQAKKNDKGQYSLVDDKLLKTVSSQLDLEVDLRNAILNEEIVVHYQPLVDLRTGEISSFEALVRWVRADGKMFSPDRFIPIAEETGIIVQIGERVLDLACKQLKAWQSLITNQKIPPIAVNVSVRQLQSDEIVDRLLQVILDNQVDPSLLKLEVTESVLMDDPERVGNYLQRFTDFGLKILIDDFGTGYSSLAYLTEFNIDGLKIDQSFVATMAQSQKNMDLLLGIIDLTSRMSIACIAEGIETVQQLDALSEMGVAYGQGYYFSRPVSSPEATALLYNGVKFSKRNGRLESVIKAS